MNPRVQSGRSHLRSFDSRLSSSLRTRARRSVASAAACKEKEEEVVVVVEEERGGGKREGGREREKEGEIEGEKRELRSVQKMGLGGGKAGGVELAVGSGEERRLAKGMFGVRNGEFEERDHK
eukprot:4139242-Pleurochrysis_carterae.AAC.2